ncbi:periplasmic chaperone for outer membrane proteins SurA [Shimia abyssi]|uniref:Parvulin-like PPIase n=2 Tax=Shimia abyssi TaxID=1662395 RepID=A0A2P8FG93_9RHOB|nr:periplasmic chaperone for outer membrane proteins SurA [Shimia abyssi]
MTLRANIRRLFAGLLAASLTPLAAAPIAAQSAYSPAITINDRVITYYEIEQRALLMAVLNRPGDPRKLARQDLIEDRLKLEAAEIAGIQPSEDGVQAGIAELASRANLEADDFLKALAAEGVDPQTMYDFTYAGIAWRGVVQTRFGPRVQITEEEIDRAIASNTGAGGIRVLLSEIVIPATPQTREQVTQLALQLADIRSFADFEAAARTYSASATKEQGGKIEWMSITNLPPQLRPILSALGPGEVTDPVQLPNAVALFQMRGVEETSRTTPRYSAIDYALFYLPGGRSADTLKDARKIRDAVDRCDDLYGFSQDRPLGTVVREALPPADIPRDIALELARLDDNEISMNLTSPNGELLMMVMLCGRTAELGEELSREDVASALRAQRLDSFADSYLAQLRADAHIVEK